MSLAEILKSHRVAEAKDIKRVFDEITRAYSLVLIRDVNSNWIEEFENIAVGPFSLRKEGGSFYIAGYDAKERSRGVSREKHMRIVDSENLPGIVELREPGREWYAPSFGAIRIYIPR